MGYPLREFGKPSDGSTFMKKENLEKYREFIVAIHAGRQLQVAYNDDGELKWKDFNDDFFSLSPEYYRVKPDPREWWMVIYGPGAEAICSSKEKADELVRKAHRTATAILVREVL